MPVAATPSSLDSRALALRLSELAGEEREVPVDFLIHLAEFDARRAFVEAGHPSLWSYCLAVLHLREGAAGRRIGAMRVLIRFPTLEPALRDGRLSLSTIAVLGPVLTAENVDDLAARAAYKTKREVEELVVSLRPRSAPKPGIRKLPELASARDTAALLVAVATAAQDRPANPCVEHVVAMPVESTPEPSPVQGGVRPKRPTELQPVAADQWSLRVTMDRALKEDLETLRCLLAHKVPDGDLSKVLHEAIRCAVEKHGKRRGAVAPARTSQRSTTAERKTREPSAEVKREVWRRDGGRCTFVAGDGRRCESRWKLEYDHIDEEAPATVANTRLRCRPHNILHAEETYGREHMDLFRRDRAPRAEEPQVGVLSQQVRRPEVKREPQDRLQDVEPRYDDTRPRVERVLPAALPEQVCSAKGRRDRERHAVAPE